MRRALKKEPIAFLLKYKEFGVRNSMYKRSFDTEARNRTNG